MIQNMKFSYLLIHRNEITNSYSMLIPFSNLSEKCGKTTKVKGKIGELNCDNDICHCYGDICLVNGNCSHGNVYVSGTPVCNTKWGIQGAPGARVTCKALGFYDKVSTSKTTIR